MLASRAEGETVAGFIRTAKAALARERERFRNRSFLEATMAASALVAMADGEVKFSELSALDDLLESVRELQVYDPHVAVDLCRFHVDAIAADAAAGADAGKVRALEVVGRIAGDDEAARLVIQMCLVISRSDGEFSDSEADMVRDLCAALWLDPGDVGL
jgi:tellurite resistance protein